MRIRVFASLLPLLLTAVACADDWPRFLGPLGTSVSPEKGIKAWPKGGPKVLWHRKAGIGYAPPAISKGKLYLFDRVEDMARLSCLDAKTGEFQWKFEYETTYSDRYSYNGGPRCSPIVDGDRVYLYGVEGMIHCLSVKDGSVVWKVDTKKDFGFVQNFFGVGSAPVIEDDLLIAMVGGSPPGSDMKDFGDVKPNGSAIVAFDKNSGKVKYKIGDDLASYSSPALATIDGRRWCFAFCRAGLLAFEPKSGKVDFHFPWRAPDYESVNAANPVVVGNEVLITETYGPGAALLKVKPGGYDVVWTDAKKTPTKKSLQCHWMTPIHKDGFVYGSSGRHDRNAQLRCVELATGKVMWTVPDLNRTSLLMIDGHFVCLSEDGTLRLLKVDPKEFTQISAVELEDRKTGQPLLEYPCWAAPVVANGLMYIRSEKRLVCVELIGK
ncbi:MAG: PQQ-binding-like beta-propeller repeat protein [Gemmataceae bacterium]